MLRYGDSKTQIPTLMVTGGTRQAGQPPERVKQLYEDLGTRQKVLDESRLSSHNAMWEKHHLVLFRASLEWLQNGTVNGQTAGMLKMGYQFSGRR